MSECAHTVLMAMYHVNFGYPVDCLAPLILRELLAARFHMSFLSPVNGVKSLKQTQSTQSHQAISRTGFLLS